VADGGLHPNCAQGEGAEGGAARVAPPPRHPATRNLPRFSLSHGSEPRRCEGTCWGARAQRLFAPAPVHMRPAGGEGFAVSQFRQDHPPLLHVLCLCDAGVFSGGVGRRGPRAFQVLSRQVESTNLRLAKEQPSRRLMLEKNDSAHGVIPALAGMAGLSTDPFLMYQMVGVDVLHVLDLGVTRMLVYRLVLVYPHVCGKNKPVCGSTKGACRCANRSFEEMGNRCTASMAPPGYVHPFSFSIHSCLLRWWHSMHEMGVGADDFLLFCSRSLSTPSITLLTSPSPDVQILCLLG